jgi:hypothetical protein
LRVCRTARTLGGAVGLSAAVTLRKLYLTASSVPLSTAVPPVRILALGSKASGSGSCRANNRSRGRGSAELPVVSPCQLVDATHALQGRECNNKEHSP